MVGLLLVPQDQLGPLILMGENIQECGAVRKDDGMLEILDSDHNALVMCEIEVT